MEHSAAFLVGLALSLSTPIADWTYATHVMEASSASEPLASSGCQGCAFVVNTRVTQRPASLPWMDPIIEEHELDDFPEDTDGLDVGSDFSGLFSTSTAPPSPEQDPEDPDRWFLKGPSMETLDPTGLTFDKTLAIVNEFRVSRGDGACFLIYDPNSCEGVPCAFTYILDIELKDFIRPWKSEIDVETNVQSRFTINVTDPSTQRAVVIASTSGEECLSNPFPDWHGDPANPPPLPGVEAWVKWWDIRGTRKRISFFCGGCYFGQ